MSKFRIEPYGHHDKSFTIEGPLTLEVDNDDVPTDQVAILARHLVDCLNAYWQDPQAWFCENEDCEEMPVIEVGLRSKFTPNYDRCPMCEQRMTLRTISL